DQDLRTRNKLLRFATWNVRTLSTPGSSDILAEELSRYDLDVVALQEVRWPYDGKSNTNEYQIYYSGNNQGRFQYGVAIAVRNKIDSAVISFNAVTDRICTMRLKGKFKNISVVSFYAPTEEAEDEDKDTFYETLEEVCSNIPNYDMKILLGDANAKVGRETFWKPVAGSESLHPISNNNGTRLLSLALSFDYKIVSTMFPRKDIHKITWNSPSGQVKNQIDHVLIDSRHRSSITNVRSVRGAECGSDHNLVLVKVKQRIAIEKRIKSQQQPRIEIEKLKDPITACQFRTKIQNNLITMTEEQQPTTINEKWNALKKMLQESTKEICGEKERKSGKPWFDTEAKELVKKRKIQKQKWLSTQNDTDKQLYNTLNRETNKALRRKKRTWLNSLVTRAEEDRTMNNSKDFYRTIRFFKKPYTPRTYGIKDKNGRTVIQEKEGLEIWKEYFENLLNGETTNEQQVVEKVQNVQPQIEPPSFVEVQQAIKELKNNKAPGEDGISTEVLKAGGITLATKIHELILEIWENETLPEEWKEAIVIPIHKKGDKLDCNNYRGISLINCTYKIFSKLLLHRLEHFTLSFIEEHQAGFIKGRSTTDQIFIVKEAIAKYWEFNRDFYLTFVDFSKAYDSLNRRKIWHKMEIFGVPDKIINLARLCTEDSKCKVKVNGLTSSSFNVNTGVRQGDGISPTLFNIAIEGALQKINRTGGGIKMGKKVNILAFADDVVIVAETVEETRNLMNILIEETEEVGLKINETKTKFMHVSRNKTRGMDHMEVGNYNFERVNSFKYLGVTLTDDNQEDVEIQMRLNSAIKSSYACNKLLSSKLLSRCSKIRIYKTIIRPVLTYGSENWIITKKTEKKMITFENKILRKIYGPTYENGGWRIKHNKELRDLYKEPDIVGEMKSSRLRWTGHVLRKNEESNVKNIWKNNPEGRRPKGRPKSRWWDQVKKDMVACDLSKEDADNRIKWRQAVGEAKYRLRYAWPWM
ncbi:hypothetical protein WDU94_008926, partial [Cyamophila willieti]